MDMSAFSWIRSSGESEIHRTLPVSVGISRRHPCLAYIRAIAAQ
jgi:hypothetical protein